MLRKIAVLFAGLIFGWIPPEAAVMLVDPVSGSGASREPAGRWPGRPAGGRSPRPAGGRTSRARRKVGHQVRRAAR